MTYAPKPLSFTPRMVGDILVLDHAGGGCAPATMFEKECLGRIAELEAALLPFANAVYRDNGDVTITDVDTGHYLRAKRLLDVARAERNDSN